MSGFLHIVAPSVDVDVEILMGAGPATPVGGLGGWQQKERPDAKAMTEWTGQETVMQSIPLLLNGFMEGNSIQGQANDIIALGRKTTDDEVPPVFRMFGPIHFGWLPWVLESVDWGEAEDQVIRDENTRLMRQEVTLHVAEYEGPDSIRTKRIRHPFGTSAGGGTNFPTNIYIVHKGDTLAKIAAKVYGDRSRWKEIGAKNGINDPNQELKVGRELKLPTSSKTS